MKLSSVTTYFAAVIIITAIMGLIYVSVQQTYRTGANDPQLQIARDISNHLGNNHSIQNLCRLIV